MKEVLLLKDEKILNDKIMELMQVNNQIENEINDMRYHGIFW